jgi:hypothetical protein
MVLLATHFKFYLVKLPYSDSGASENRALAVIKTAMVAKISSF